jgi:PAS domain S-box-containing protein
MIKIQFFKIILGVNFETNLFDCFKKKQEMKQIMFPSNFMQDILDSLEEGVFTVDKNFKINCFNQAAERITGFDRTEVIGSYCKNIFSSERCFENCPMAHVLENGLNLQDIENNIFTKTGKEKTIKLNAAIFNSGNGEAIGGVISFRDMSYLEKVEETLKKRTHFHGIIGHSKQMREIYTLIKEIAAVNSSVLITGESGTGKELIADAIQKESNRSNKPYVKVNCSVFPPDLLSSELFGHIRGAFTDARSNRVGRFEMAKGGTIFLDEIGETPLQMQIQLLRVIQEGTFERVGESVTRKVDVRIIAATNIDLMEAIKLGKFRDDLYFRLNVIPVYVPPLNERKEDISYLIRHFINKININSSKKIVDIADDAMDALLAYTWPGNIRELENAIEYVFARSNDDIIHRSKLPPTLKMIKPCKELFRFDNDENKKNNIIELLDRYRWNKTLVAKELKIGRTTLWRKLKLYGLDQ